MNLTIQRGCVYFFRHVGLTPIKIGYSESESPIHRFNQFKTYAPYGSEILGFIIISDAKELETILHRKYVSKRLNGEWFEITEKEVESEIEFYTNVADIKDRNDFQIAWAKHIQNQKEKVKNSIINNKPINKFDEFKKLYLADKNLNRSHASMKLEVSRKCVHDWIKKINKP